MIAWQHGRPPAYHQSAFRRLYSRAAELLDHKIGWYSSAGAAGSGGSQWAARRAQAGQSLRHQRRARRGPAAGGAAHPGGAHHPDRRRHVQRPGPARRWAWPGRGSAATCRSRTPTAETAVAVAGAQPPRGEPGAADPRRAHPGDGAQRAGRHLAAVHDPGLVQPRDEPDRPSRRDPARRRRPVAARPDADHADPARPDPPRRASDRRPTHANTEHPLVGPVPDLRDVGAEHQQRVAVRRRTASCASTADGLPPLPDDPAHDPRRVPGFWTGLLMLQTLFTLEHNAICDQLRASYPHWDGRGALPAGTAGQRRAGREDPHVEWTPAVISHPTTGAACGQTGSGLPVNGCTS